ncbi:HIT domain-containing protein [Pseudomonas sp. RIT-PI-AD]|uniref:HIT domain-containing protein n=1 Tax=Pseudomonas sp. RIT-PI-AD TaxID=3035294 RepID=UPI0021D7E2CD|nr:HIT domain-containing protein [Pseudomonas sp. RIT-PI-AD]
MFVLDPRLQQDTLPMGDFPLSRLLLMNDARFPWFILVPRRENASEVFELSQDDRRALWLETTLLSERLSTVFEADKMNVATLGNVVAQLHMHVIVRRQGDAAWPAPVWGRPGAQPYEQQAVGVVREKLRSVLTSEFTFVEG